MLQIQQYCGGPAQSEMNVEGKTEKELCLRWYDFTAVGVWSGAERYTEETVEGERFGARLIKGNSPEYIYLS